MELSASLAAWSVLLGCLGLLVSNVVYNVLAHPLKAFPGPLAAGASTWWKTYIEVFKQKSMTDVLVELHAKYGDVVRVGPNELHFAKPSAFNDIYNASSRWDKERTLYESFGEDHSSFGLRNYAEAKQRKDVLQPLFSRRSIINMQALVREKMDRLAETLSKNNEQGKSADLLFAFRCFAIDTITTYCFAKSVDAIDEPAWQAPIVVAMDNSLPTFHVFKHFPIFRKLIFSLPPWLAIKMSPETAGLTHLQVILGEQVREVSAHPERLASSPHTTIYHRLLDPEAHKGRPLPDATALYEEAQTMVFAGGVTVGDALSIGFFHVLDQPGLLTRLRAEVCTAWPDLDSPPKLEALETLPFLTATIKESLRMSPGASSPLLRIVPPAGATISGRAVPPGTIVGMSTVLVHMSPEIFEEPTKFKPDRWLAPDAESLGPWLVAFSKGPRSCLGLNLAWCELYIVFATMLRRFDMSLDGTTAEDMVWRDCFTPHFPRRHLHAWCNPQPKI
ncbi:putative P450 monooxygenase [Coniochaeta ligniaria NRRL 30616]|uniref:Putative P450 monooxygenase n=1 Tax=Coniochaeta ligniaria NRRL 30616 TaxID=1408157 RepID=A0A1J7JAQ9_9PEZI|nr:putative P450 monooxygenase [Coniochaeta ligniaria NRRL 30616]